MENLIINGTFVEVNKINNYDGRFEIETPQGDYTIFQDAEEAGKATEQYWRDMA